MQIRTIEPRLIAAEKAPAVKPSGLLEIVEVRTTLNRISGLNLIKDWLWRRKDVFRQLAQVYGLPLCITCHSLIWSFSVGPSQHFRIRGEIMIMLRFERRVCRWESCRVHQFHGALAQQKRRPAQDGKGEGANPSRATNLIQQPT